MCVSCCKTGTADDIGTENVGIADFWGDCTGKRIEYNRRFTAPVHANRWLAHVTVGRGKGNDSVALICQAIMAELCLMKNWVILFVRTGSEEKLKDTLKANLNAEEFLPFVPVKETPYRSRGIVHRRRKPLFPGYIFIQTGIAAHLIADRLAKALKNIKGSEHIYSILHYGDEKKDVAVREEERLRWERLFDENFCVAGSVGFIVGDAIRITSGALMGMESQIKKINRHKREALVEMHIMGAVREVTLMLEVVEKR